MAPVPKPKTTRKEHDTPRRVRYRYLVLEQGQNQTEAAQILQLKRTTAREWLQNQDSDRRTRRTGKRLGRRPIILDEKI